MAVTRIGRLGMKHPPTAVGGIRKKLSESGSWQARYEPPSGRGVELTEWFFQFRGLAPGSADLLSD
jgi:hypothetical protein